MPERGNSNTPDARIKVLFVSALVWSDPPNPTLVKKWSGLSGYFDATVVSFGGFSKFTKRELHGSKWYLIPHKLPRLIRYIWHFLTVVYLILTTRPTVVVCQSPYEAFAPAVLLRWCLRFKLIVEVHADWTEGIRLYHNLSENSLEYRLRLLIGKFCIARADAFRVISEFTRGLVPKDRPVYKFPTYTDIEPFRDAKPFKTEDKYFIYVGMLIKLKGVDYLIRAFQQLLKTHPEVRLLIFGKGEDESSFRMLVDDPLQITFMGNWNANILAEFIKGSIALVMPSLSEALGRVAIEAHWCGRPVIAFDVGGVNEVVEHQYTGALVEKGYEEGLYKAMKAMIKDPKMADELGDFGRKLVEKHFNYSTYFEDYNNMIREVNAQD